MAGSPSARFAPKPEDPFDAEEVVAAFGVLAAEVRRHRVGERAFWAGMDGDLRWQIRVGDEGDKGRSGERETLLDRRHRGFDICCGQIRQRR